MAIGGGMVGTGIGDPVGRLFWPNKLRCAGCGGGGSSRSSVEIGRAKG